MKDKTGIPSTPGLEKQGYHDLERRSLGAEHSEFSDVRKFLFTGDVPDSALSANVILKTLFDVQTILAAVLDDTPVAVTIAEQQIIGRLTGGNIKGLTVAEVQTLLDIVTRTLYDAQTILIAISDNTPIALTVNEQSVVGRVTGGNIVALTKSQLWSIVADYAHIFVVDNTTAMTIQSTNDWHLMSGIGAGQLSSGWSFTNGASKTITAYATSDGGTKTQVTSAGHGMSNGDIISIAGTTSYDGVWVIEQVAADTFVINTPFVADDGVSTGEYGAFLKSTAAGSTGKYLVNMSCTITNATLNDVLEMTVFKNATQQSGMLCRVTLGTPGAFTTASQIGIVDYTNGDRIVMGMRNVGGTGNFTMRNCSLSVTRIG